MIMLKDCQIKEIKFLLADEVKVKIFSEIEEKESYVALTAVEPNDEWHMFDVKQYDYEKKNGCREALRQIIEADIKELRQEIFDKCGYMPEYEIQEN